MATISRGTVRSFQKAAAQISKAAKRLNGPLGRSLYLIGEEIMTDVKASRSGHGVPVDTGTLRSTGAVKQLGSVAKPQVALSFGGPAAPYALIQHENTSYHHKVGEARYLVRGLERWKAGGSAAYSALKKNAEAGLKTQGNS